MKVLWARQDCVRSAITDEHAAWHRQRLRLQQLNSVISKLKYTCRLLLKVKDVVISWKSDIVQVRDVVVTDN